ncbi:hypothetical protein AJ80_04134 [Polytolypa hystricis UAMH7299]|uniref:Uncharacterized protein n=1 Tax=Polytolypa hystricis (strain UAMH7299) TaxID=1447883 RepID=A0A2B7YED4_POLH7|nr:hypothetical protein AJ80_04134 [Polytolypa hystricis UAMH7299]
MTQEPTFVGGLESDGLPLHGYKQPLLMLTSNPLITERSVNPFHPSGSLYIFPVESANLLHLLWKAKPPTVARELIEENADVYSIDVLRIGPSRTAKQNHITILISAVRSENPKTNWSSVLTSFHSSCAKEGMPPIDVAVKKVEHPESSPVQLSTPYPKSAFMGASIGNGKSETAQTLGGYVNLFTMRGRGRKLLAGLTTHDIISNEQTINIRSGPNNNVVISCPAVADSIVTKDKLMERFQTQNGALRAIESRAAMIPPSQYTDDLLGEWLHARLKHDETESEIAQTRNFCDHLGTVLGASGPVISRDRRFISWALIKIDEDRMARNQLPGTHDRLYLPTFLIPGRQVKKIGRSTNRTSGEMNSIDSFVRPDGFDGYDDFAMQRCVVNTYDALVRPGDNGSWLVDPTGQVGAVITGLNGFHIAYATDMALIFPNIEDDTGYKVFLPYPLRVIGG